MNQVKKPELLAPVGDFERLAAAVTYGADAVYLGGTAFGMRAASANFDLDTLRRAVGYAHAHGVKVYLTCNTLPRGEEVDQLPQYLKDTAACGVDAFIISDIGVMMLAKQVAPQVEIHISTQAGVVNYLTARELYRLGAKRVVLARELSLEEIAVIRENTPPDLEIEAFVHGAMCMSFSGRCLLSSYLTGRDANRGECAQPCRWGYHLVEEKRPGQYFPVFEDERGSYILNAKDLCMIEHLDRVISAGVTSLKIEGRAKSSYYVSVVTNAYRCAIDQYLSDPKHYSPEPWIVEETRKVSHRAYCTGFYFGPIENGQYYENAGYIRSYDVVAIVDGYENGCLLCTQRNKFSVGEQVEILEPGRPPRTFVVDTLLDEQGAPIQSANHAVMRLQIPSQIPACPGAILRKAVL